jgi:hypothetical protein
MQAFNPVQALELNHNDYFQHAGTMSGRGMKLTFSNVKKMPLTSMIKHKHVLQPSAEFLQCGQKEKRKVGSCRWFSPTQESPPRRDK